MTKTNLTEVYKELNKNIEKVFVVPIINRTCPETDYLNRIYSEFLNGSNSDIRIEDISVFAHPKIFFSFLFDRRSILHYHWVEAADLKSFFGIFWKFIWLFLYKAIGGKIVWTIHNKFPHTENYTSFNKVIRRIMASIADRLHVHCNYAKELMAEVLNVNSEKFFVFEHPHFIVHLDDKNNVLHNMNSKYDLSFSENEILFLMFGNIASYKGIIECAEIFSKLSSENKLLIAGKTKPGHDSYVKSVKQYSEKFENIILIDKMIPEDDVPIFFNSADVILFNYKQILTSGGIILALDYNKKVLAPSLGCISELNNENLLLFEQSNERSLLDLIKKA